MVDTSCPSFSLIARLASAPDADERQEAWYSESEESLLCRASLVNPLSSAEWANWLLHHYVEIPVTCQQYCCNGWISLVMS